MSRPETDPRHLALEILLRVERGGYADLTLDEILRRHPHIDPRDRGLLTELVYGVLRRRGRLDYVLARQCRKPLARLEEKVLQILRIGVYQLLELKRIPDAAAVNTSVNLAKRLGLQRAAGFINGVLRGLLRTQPELQWPDPGAQHLSFLVHACSLPEWLARSWLDAHGFDTARRLAEAQLQPAPLSVRCNTLVQSPEAFGQLASSLGLSWSRCRFASEGFQFESRRAFELLPAGSFQPQDEASMLVAHLLQPEPGETLLDACAAPGGKTTHLAALGGNRLEIHALDLHPARVELIRRGAERLGCRGIRARVWDMTRKPDWLASGSLDAVLVDAPCTGLGVLRRNPEIRWRRRAGDPARMAELQRILLDRAAELVRPGGRLLYSVCTTTPEETVQVVDRFAAAHPDFVLEDLRPLFPDWASLFDQQGRLATWPGHPELDGFFAARFRRIP
ncbi:16S rRNA (cytosine967-C5)-methyltransferase [Geothermobacter ehrlichii]|uniref:16S rRNA (cytosine(967)-C(5))-methyltransferase n=1 Tax=Geothermobacter ehrlichii TaxID=213224 RepID=A0A5D3WM25_9BACT|nr:16S rRNA (cytosine(967)-C(5))-methyltransferase RsmB [Geothermobacter ehrlichii]TYO99253.1 16S rRNA (cytosine967-C5)-methyltransferase [Geothermobacter ehrlichii]